MYLGRFGCHASWGVKPLRQASTEIGPGEGGDATATAGKAYSKLDVSGLRACRIVRFKKSALRDAPNRSNAYKVRVFGILKVFLLRASG